MEGLWARLVKVKASDCNSCTFNRIPHNLKHYSPRNKLFYKITLLRKETVHLDFAEATEDSRTASTLGGSEVRWVSWERGHREVWHHDPQRESSVEQDKKQKRPRGGRGYEICLSLDWIYYLLILFSDKQGLGNSYGFKISMQQRFPLCQFRPESNLSTANLA